MFSGGTGTKDDPFLIKTEQDLRDIDKKNLDGKFHYKQNEHITISSTWDPICNGSSTPPFWGTYDGGNFDINGLNIVNEEHSQAGLFGLLDGSGTIKNLRLITPTVLNNKENASCGSLVGLVLRNANVENISISEPDVNDTNGGTIGGAFGNVQGANIKKMEVVNANVSGYYNVGCFCGSCARTNYENCSATGTVTKLLLTPDTTYLRGGIFSGNSYLSESKYKNCYAAGLITGDMTNLITDKWSIGMLFLLASNDSNEMTSCYGDAETLINYSWEDDVWYNDYGGGALVKGTDENIYVCIKTQGDQDYNYWGDDWTEPPERYPPFYRAKPISGELWENYWEPILGNPKFPEARTTAQMKTQENYIGWDFENVWKIKEGEYPRLRFSPIRKSVKCKRMPLANYRR
ncbi:hypothetical protein FJQ98_20430 [Lysinibacillus agricola]|uniref:GLUG domain-containing protein n=1 Tax=Lysinibacillus agricola TaxID=2590012 RepID=A0ABX7AQR0_9BACI|nr:MULTISPECIES: hypothetical protein [Lysinibacillus]KOS60906.1 hypothetical protein AN161_20225 [Lysinibacillus sp. FJAT-14222]QQP11540.1 hypothetical protein FJQ98_20430 [Lysinibacillus agricola]